MPVRKGSQEMVGGLGQRGSKRRSSSSVPVPSALILEALVPVKSGIDVCQSSSLDFAEGVGRETTTRITRSSLPEIHKDGTGMEAFSKRVVSSKRPSICFCFLEDQCSQGSILSEPGSTFS